MNNLLYAEAFSQLFLVMTYSWWLSWKILLYLFCQRWKILLYLFCPSTIGKDLLNFYQDVFLSLLEHLEGVWFCYLLLSFNLKSIFYFYQSINNK